MTYTINNCQYIVQLKNGYYQEKKSNKFIHRIIAEKKLKRKLKSWEIVHHIDYNKLNNHPNNLFVCYWEFHNLIHQNKITKNNFWDFIKTQRKKNNFYRFKK